MIPGFLALPKGLTEWARLIAVFVLAVLITTPLAYCEGKSAERSAWEAKVARLAVKAEKIQRAADEVRRKAEAIDKARITDNRKEVDDATRNIPDQATSARQRARACVELQRQAAATGQPKPAC